MTTLTSPCRLYGVPARDAPVIALLRRGPSRWMRLILWHTDADIFEAGQWFQGKIYHNRSALSPDGSLFVYFAQKINQRTLTDRSYTHAWTAVSRPPYLTALALWPKGDCYNGGGVFADNRTLQLNHERNTMHPRHRTTWLKVVAGQANPWYARGEDEPLNSAITTHLGWHLIQDGEIPDRIDQIRGWLSSPSQQPGHSINIVMSQVAIKRHLHPTGRFALDWIYYGYDSSQYGDGDVIDFVLTDQQGGATLRLPDATWADWDQQGRLVYARAGQIFASDPEQAGDVSIPLADFNDQQPERMASPAWARRWPKGGGQS